VARPSKGVLASLTFLPLLYLKIPGSSSLLQRFGDLGTHLSRSILRGKVREFSCLSRSSFLTLLADRVSLSFFLSVDPLPGFREFQSFSSSSLLLLLMLIIYHQPLGVLIPYITYRLHLRFPDRGFDKVRFLPSRSLPDASLIAALFRSSFRSSVQELPSSLNCSFPLLLHLSSPRSLEADLVASFLRSSDHRTSSSPPSSLPSSSTSTSLADTLAGSRPIPSPYQLPSMQQLLSLQWPYTYSSPLCLALPFSLGGAIPLEIQSIVRLSSLLLVLHFHSRLYLISSRQKRGRGEDASRRDRSRKVRDEKSSRERRRKQEKEDDISYETRG